MEPVQYEERQRFFWWLYPLLIGGTVWVAIVPFLAWRDGAMTLPAAYATSAGSLVLMLALINIMMLRIRVHETHVHASLGAVFPMLWRRIPLADIEEMRVVRYRPLRDAGGYGMRMGRFEKTYTVFWNARGTEGVLVRTAKRQYILGSQQPETLKEALERATSLTARR